MLALPQVRGKTLGLLLARRLANTAFAALASSLGSR